MKFYSPAVRKLAAEAASRACAAVAAERARAEQFSAASPIGRVGLLLGGYGEAEQFSAARRPAPGQRSLFDEDEHPRADDGKFATKAGGGGAAAAPVKAAPVAAPAPPVQAQTPAPARQAPAEARRPRKTRLPAVAADANVSSDGSNEKQKAAEVKVRPHFKAIAMGFAKKAFKGGDLSGVSRCMGLYGDKLADESVEIYGGGDHQLSAKVGDGKRFSLSRTFYVDAKTGEKSIYNDFFFVGVEHQGEGLGLEVFSQQVDAAAAEGFSYISTQAAGYGTNHEYGNSMNGYYTWPRFGYDQEISNLRNPGPVQRKFPRAKTILDVMATKEGRQWWKDNGTPLDHAKFDLTPGSRSMKVLEAYRAEAAAAKAAEKAKAPAVKSGTKKSR